MTVSERSDIVRHSLPLLMRRHGLSCTPRQIQFAEAYTNPDGPAFLNATKSAQAAGYASPGVSGTALEARLKAAMAEYLNRDFSPAERVLAKMFQLMEAKTTKHFAHLGVVQSSRDLDDNTTQLNAAKFLADLYVKPYVPQAPLKIETNQGDGLIVEDALWRDPDMPTREDVEAGVDSADAPAFDDWLNG